MIRARTTKHTTATKEREIRMGQFGVFVTFVAFVVHFWAIAASD